MLSRHHAIGGVACLAAAIVGVGTIADKAVGKHYVSGVRPGRVEAEDEFDSDEDAKLKQSIAALKDGILSYTSPSSMKTGERADFDAAIGPSTITGVLKAGAKNQVHNVPTKIGLRMEADLIGDDFEIISAGPKLQAVDGATPTIWHWTVKPKRSGKLELYLAVRAVLGDVSKTYATADEVVTVQVDKGDAVSTFLKEEWKWILSSVAAGIALVWKFFGFPTTLSPSKPIEENKLVSETKPKRRRGRA